MSSRSLAFFAVGLTLALLLGWVGFPRLLYGRAEQPLTFSHRLHTSDETGMSCEDCHAFRDDGSFAGVPSLESCVGCHEEPAGESEAERRLVEEYVRPGREIPWRVYSRQPENVRFPHAVHVKRAAIGCERCHGGHGTSEGLRPVETNRLTGYSRDIWGPSMVRAGLEPGRGMKMSDCESCHEEHGRAHTACLACHK